MERFGSLAGVTATLGRNAVPAAGLFLFDWQSFEPMFLYLGENIAMLLLAALTVRLLAPEQRQGEERHDPAKANTRGDLLRTFLLVGGGFTLVATVIVTFIGVIRGFRPDRSFLSSLGIMLATQFIGFVWDLFARRGLTFSQYEHALERSLGRVFLLAAGVFLGIWGAVLLGASFVVPFIVLKTLADLWRYLPKAGKEISALTS